MPSPFPGMDPYLEARWASVHGQLASFMAESLQPVLPAGLRARPQENIVLESDDPAVGGRWREADTVIVESRDRAPAQTSAQASTLAGGVLTVEPVLIRHQPSVVRDRWIEILDSTRGGRVVTAVEILSPSNKRAGRHNRRYRDKLDRYDEAGVAVVELDLLRSSRRRPPVDSLDVPAGRRQAYYACVLRSGASDWEVYPLPLRLPLAAIPIPCRPGEPDVMLPLQPLMDRVYVAGAHDDIDYAEPPDPPLRGDDAAWAEELLRAGGHR